MRQIISTKTASYMLIFLFTCSMIFHLFVISGIIDFNIIWGGRINSSYEMYVFEVISLITNALFLFIVLLKAEFLKLKISLKFINIGLWFMSVLFSLNTVGNLFSKNEMEKAIFTPITLICAILCLILAMNKTKQEASK